MSLIRPFLGTAQWYAPYLIPNVPKVEVILRLIDDTEVDAHTIKLGYQIKFERDDLLPVYAGLIKEWRYR